MAGEILVIVNSDLQVTVQNNVVQATVIAPPPTLVNVISPVVPTSIEVISTGPPGPPGPPGVGELNPNHSLLINLDADDHSQYHNDARHALIDHSGLPGVGGGSGHSIQDEGVPLPRRSRLNFVGAGVATTDDVGNDASVVTISGGGGGAVASVNTQTGVVVLNAADVGADPAGAAVGEVTSHEGNIGVHTITGVTGLQTALDGKSGTSHNHDAAYYTQTDVDQAFSAHGTSDDHDGQYYEQAVLNTLLNAKENTGVAAGAVTAHEGGTGVHTIAGTTGLQTALDDKLEPIEVLSGVNISVDTTTTPGSVIVNALGFTVGGMMQSEWVWLAAAHAGGQLPSGRAALASDSPSTPADTTLYMHQEDVPNVDWSFYIQDLDVGWVIYAQEKSNSTSWHRWNVRGTPTLNVDTWEIPVQTLAGSPQGTEPSNNGHIMVGFESPHTMSHSALEDLGLDGAHPQYSLTSHDHAGSGGSLDIQWGDEPTSPTEGMVWVELV